MTRSIKRYLWVAWKSICRQKDLGGLGFRDIGRFNQALLGKQAWRIWDQPSSLLAQIIKHRYFKKKSFLEMKSYVSLTCCMEYQSFRTVVPCRGYKVDSEDQTFLTDNGWLCLVFFNPIWVQNE